MIICLEEEVLPFIPSASEHMLKDCEAKDLQEFIPLINQITAKFKVRVYLKYLRLFVPTDHFKFNKIAALRKNSHLKNGYYIGYS